MNEVRNERKELTRPIGSKLVGIPMGQLHILAECLEDGISSMREAVARFDVEIGRNRPSHAMEVEMMELEVKTATKALENLRQLMFSSQTDKDEHE